MKALQKKRRANRARGRVPGRPAKAAVDRSSIREVLGYSAPSVSALARESASGVPAGSVAVNQAPVVQRKCDDCAREDESKTGGAQAAKQPEEEIQRKSEPGRLPEPEAVSEVLGGARVGGSGLPTAERTHVEGHLGCNLGGVRVHADSHAADLSARLSARAFTVGNDVYFGQGEYQPQTQHGRFLIAHELTHVAQQRQGVQVEGGVGREGDAYERQADAVGEKVARGEPAPATANPAESGATAASTPAVQRYAEVTGQPYDRLSDDGKLAVKDHKRDAWAEPSQITQSNKVLDGLKSKVKVEELSGNDVTVTPPGKKSTVTLKKFRMINRVGGGGETELVDDCGGANQQILGSETLGYESFVGVNKRGTTQEYTSPSAYIADDNAAGGIVSTTEKMSGEIYIRIFEREFKKTLSRKDALKEWAKLDAAEQKRLSQKYGINEFAVPEVGQGITIGSERDMPGSSQNGYNFHFGFNLMMSGPDYITLEDYDSSGVRYYFDMYGPESKGQAWAQAASNVNALDDRFTVMVVQHPESLKGTINTAAAHFEDDPGAATGTKALDKGTQVVILRKGVSWMKVEVKSGPRTGQSGWILNQFFSGT
jgi:hypothetical protein